MQNPLYSIEIQVLVLLIGPSNLSNAAISSGLEWNMKITEQDSKDILKKFNATFEVYWNDKEFTVFHIGDSDILMRALIAEREIHGKFKNLIVAATGIGKTVISAFDYKNFRKQNPNRSRLLFIAHREEILKQSIATFRGILKNQNFNIAGLLPRPR